MECINPFNERKKQNNKHDGCPSLLSVDEGHDGCKPSFCVNAKALQTVQMAPSRGWRERGIDPPITASDLPAIILDNAVKTYVHVVVSFIHHRLYTEFFFLRSVGIL